MSQRKKYKRQNGNFVQMHNWVMTSQAWATMKPGPRALYLELKRLFHGTNNGRIFLSHRDAANALNVGRDTVGTYYRELVDRGFLRVTRGHCLGPDGIGQSTIYALTEEPENGQPATKEFLVWKKQNPRQKIQLSLAGKSDTSSRKILRLPNQTSENPTANSKKAIEAK